ncbi:MAG: deoxyribodipyrimidine photo-lyase [Planctomycetota bacterium]|nr:MAG: deoxyribodipyrimidine photo-lyase [Planctomycetota bacterium]
MRALVWFRSDLRIGDNAALSQATHDADKGVVAVFVLCPGQWREHDWGGAKADFVLRNVAALSEALGKLRIPLRILRVDRFDEVPAALLGLAKDAGCDRLYYNRELEFNERQRDDEVERSFDAAGVAVRAFDDVCILQPGTVLTGQEGWYTVYSPFRKKFGKIFDESGGCTLAPKPRRQPEAPCDSDTVPTGLDSFESPELTELWPAGESHARDRLETFVRTRIADYHDNRDAPGLDGTSSLSPYLASGVISPRECLLAAMESDGRDALGPASGGDGPGTWVNELLWREFYKHLLIGFPKLSRGRNFRAEYDGLAWREDPEQFTAWCAGETGVPIVDAAMRQLVSTGWMHNRCRMIVAMFLTKNLLMDWRLGERFFMQHLVDGDLASNNGGWQWSASTGTDAAPYFRIFNPISQSKKVDPDGDYIRDHVAELGDLDSREIHDPRPLARAGAGYANSIVDVKASRQRAITVFQEFRQ